MAASSLFSSALLRLRQAWALAAHDDWAQALTQRDLAAMDRLIAQGRWPTFGHRERTRADYPPNDLFRQAVAQGDQDVAQRLLQAGAQVDGGTLPASISPRNALRTPLHLAVNQGNVAMVQWLLAHGADPHVCTALGQSVLHLAVVQKGTTPLADLLAPLLDAGVDPTLPMADGATALDLAIDRGRPVYEAARAAGVPVTQPQAHLHRYLLQEERQVDWALVDHLLAEGASLRHETQGQTLLEDRLNVPGLRAADVPEWVARGAQLGHRDAHGITLTHRLFVTARYADAEGWALYQAFQEAGLPDQLNERTTHGKSPLDVLAYAVGLDKKVAQGPFAQAFLMPGMSPPTRTNVVPFRRRR